MKAFIIAIGVTLAAASALADCTQVSVPCQQILGNSDDAHKIVIAVAGEGYTAQSSDQAQFNADVDFILTKGLFNRDFFAQHKSAFNVYRLNVPSQARGIAATARNTAFGLMYNGDHDQCWFTRGLNTDEKVVELTAGLNPDLTIIIAKTANNDVGGVGCAYSRYVVVTRAASWSVAAHELGHGIGGLFDEYVMSSSAFATTLNYANCTTSKDPSQIVWSGKITAPNVPTTEDPDDLGTIGAYPGCRGFASAIFRPSQRCRMGTTHFARFCSVCLDAMTAAVAAREAGESLPKPSGDVTALGPTPLLHVVVKLDSSSAGRVKVLWKAKSGAPRRGPPQPYSVRAIFDGRNVDERPVSIEPFTSRGYSGLAHAVVPADSMIADLYLPITEAQLEDKGIGIELWQATTLTQAPSSPGQRTAQPSSVTWRGKKMKGWGALAFKQAYGDYQRQRSRN